MFGGIVLAVVYKKFLSASGHLIVCMEVLCYAFHFITTVNVEIFVFLAIPTSSWKISPVQK